MKLLPSRTGWIGVDAGASSVKLAQVARRGRRLRLEHAAVIPRRQLADRDSLEASPSVLDEVESAVAAAGDLAGKSVAGALSMTACEIQPGRSRTAQPAAGGCSAHWQGDSEAGDDGWYTFSANATVAEALCEDLRRARFSCRTLDSMTHALARAVQLAAPGAAGRVVGALDWGYGGAQFISVLDGRPIYVRRIKNCDLAQFEEELCAEVGVSHAETHELLSAAAAGGPVDELARELVRPLADRLAGELQRTLSHLRSHRKRLTPQRLFLFGGGSLVGAESILAERAECPVLPWEPAELETQAGTLVGLLGPAVALSMLAWEDR